MKEFGFLKILPFLFLSYLKSSSTRMLQVQNGICEGGMVIVHSICIRTTCTHLVVFRVTYIPVSGVTIGRAGFLGTWRP